VSKQSIDLGTISEKSYVPPSFCLSLFPLSNPPLGPHSISLAKKLRSLSHSDFLALAQETYLGLLACIHVVDLQARVLLELVGEARDEERVRKARRRRPAGDAPPPPPSTSSTSLTVPGSAPLSVPTVAINGDPRLSTSSDDSSSSTSASSAASTAAHLLLSTEIADVVSASSELANVRFSKVLGVRTEAHSRLPLPEFLELFDLTWTFVLRCEVVCQRMIVGLRGAAVSQAKAWLQYFHQRRIEESARVVEEEQWGAVEVGRERQEEVERVVESAMRDPRGLLLGERRKGVADEKKADGEKGETKDGGEEKLAVAAAPAKQVDVEGRQFFAVGAGLTTIGVLVEYLTVLLNCPMLTTDCMSKIIEFMKVRFEPFPFFSSPPFSNEQQLMLNGGGVTCRPSTPELVKSSSVLERCDLPVSRTSQRSISVRPLFFSPFSLFLAKPLSLYSSRLPSPLYHGLPHPLHPRMRPSTPQPETGGHAY
jgi:vacuolar protein sorting-associated protein 54